MKKYCANGSVGWDISHDLQEEPMTFSEFRAQLVQGVGRLVASRDKERISEAVVEPQVAIVAAAAWFGLFTGLGEVLILTIAQYFLHSYVYYWGAYLIWMVPLADLIIFTIPAFILMLLAWRWPKVISLSVIVGVFAFFSFVSMLLLYTQLQQFAAVILAAGLAIQTARIVKARPGAFYKLCQYTVGWFGLLKRPDKRVESPERKQPAPEIDSNTLSLTRRDFLVSAGATLAGLALGVSGWEKIVENLAMVNLSPAPSQAPNVLFIVLDTVRAQNLSLYGYKRPTSPQLERFAQQSVLFTHAISTASWTLPSHASMFTGRYPHELSVNYHSGLDATYPTLAGILSKQGYETAGFVSNIYYCSHESGLNRGFIHYEDFKLSAGQILVSSSLGRTLASNEQIRQAVRYYEEFGRKPAPEMTSDFLGWLARRDKQRPFFAFINYYDAHEPYFPPSPYDTMFGPKQPRQNPRHKVGWKWSPEQIQAEMNAYDGAITYLDHQLGLLFDRLRESGTLDNTLVILASDHGEEFLEHGVIDHGYSLYWPSIHVLLTISHPSRLPSGVKVSQPVSLHDLPNTVLDLIGLGKESVFPGASLARHWEKVSGASSSPELVLSEISFTPGYPKWYPVTRGDMKSLVLEQYHYIKDGDGREELYDFENDPFEKTNLSATGAGQSVLQKFRTSLDKLL
jgi:arylsulfatase A-like enzyme